MKTKKWRYKILIAGAAAFLIGILAAYGMKMDSALSILSLPFVILGDFLRRLSLHSNIGNIGAIALYTLVSLLPLAWFWKRTNHKGRAWILPCMSLWLFYMIYNLVNPASFMNSHVPEMLRGKQALPVFQLAMSILFYSIWVAYLMCGQAETLKIRRTKEEKDRDQEGLISREKWTAMQLHKILGIAAGGITCFYAYAAAFLFRNFGTAKQTDMQWTVEETFRQQPQFTADQIIGIFRLVLSYIPVIMMVFLMIKGMELLEELGGETSEIQAEKADKLADYSLSMVYAVLICDFMENGIQFLFCMSLTDTNFTLHISFLPLILAFSARILAGFFRKNKALQEENDLFI